MRTCDRCKKQLQVQTIVIRDDGELPSSIQIPVRLDMANTHLELCYECAQNLTIIIGQWLDTHPAYDLEELIELFQMIF